MIHTPLLSSAPGSARLPSAQRTSPRASALVTLVVTTLLALALGGCDYIWEPPEVAAERLMKATANRDKRTIGEYIEDRTLESKLFRLAGHFDGPRYQGYNNFWRVDGPPEEDETSGFTYVWVLVDIPPARGSGFADVGTTEVVLEMKRDIVRWTVHDVQGIDDLLTRLER